MDKRKALGLLLRYVSIYGVPNDDTIVYTNNSINSIEQWTYKGLIKYIIEQ